MSSLTALQWPSTRSFMSLQGKTALVTGAGSGIGCSIACFFASTGASVALVDINQSSADAISDFIREHGGRSLALAADVSDAVETERVLARTLEHFQELDVLVNNAGIYPPGRPIPELDRATFERTFQVNVEGTLYYLSEASKSMNPGSSIINISSSVSIRPAGPGIAHYSASKAAVNALTRAAAVDLAPRGIRVNAILPGIVATEGTRALEEAYDSFAERTPSGRIAKPEDVASAALFLASPASSYINGQCLVVDGGASIVG